MANFYQWIGVCMFSLMSFSCGSDPKDMVPEENDLPYPQYGIPFDKLPAIEDMVIYEVNIRAFPGGNIAGVISRLDEIKSLGTNVIWLMPIHPIGQIKSVNSPYSVQDYKKVGAEYGTLEDLRTLTTLAHEKGMAVIMDWIANHTAWDNPWIENTAWYTKDNNGNIIHPAGTNWLDVADLNFTNQDMQKAMIDAMMYWVLEANIDGFRCDHVDGVPFAFWKQAIQKLRDIPNRKLVLLAEGTRADHFTAGFDIMYGWDFYYRMKDVYAGQSATLLATANTNEYQSVPNGKHRMRYTTNHDESAWENTPMVFFNGKKGALAASVPTIFMRGVPLFYTGQEVGRQNTLPFFSNVPVNWTTNPDMLKAYQDMMKIYQHEDAARKGSVSDFSTTDVVCFKKTYQNQEILVITNLRNSVKTFNLPQEFRQITMTDLQTEIDRTLTETLSLQAYEYLILKKK
ncbi:MAG: alpha-amylase [Saprospiraceae bacterium]|nr:alpha-amylase [Saprospiraceae bacterium]